MAQSLLAYNTFHIDATCNELIEYTQVEELRSILAKLRGKQWLHIGGGSNLLFVNPHYDGTILHSRIKGIEEISRNEESIILRVGAGEDWDQFVTHCVEKNYNGLENLSHIPGEVGASAVQNVGAYGVEAGDLIVNVEAVEVESGNIRIFTAEECQYAYRNSIFKHKLRNQYIITHVHYRLHFDFYPILSHTAVVQWLQNEGITPEKATAQEVRQAVVAVRQSKLPDPSDIGSAGSFFMNPIIPNEKADMLLKKYPSIPHYPTPDGTKIPAAWLIEQCGWKGKSLGRAAVHAQQALVIINKDNASGADIVQLAERIQADVNSQFGITITPEVLYIN